MNKAWMVCQVIFSLRTMAVPSRSSPRVGHPLVSSACVPWGLKLDASVMDWMGLLGNWRLWSENTKDADSLSVI